MLEPRFQESITRTGPLRAPRGTTTSTVDVVTADGRARRSSPVPERPRNTTRKAASRSCPRIRTVPPARTATVEGARLAEPGPGHPLMHCRREIAGRSTNELPPVAAGAAPPPVVAARAAGAERSARPATPAAAMRAPASLCPPAFSLDLTRSPLPIDVPLHGAYGVS